MTMMVVDLNFNCCENARERFRSLRNPFNMIYHLEIFLYDFSSCRTSTSISVFSFFFFLFIRICARLLTATSSVFAYSQKIFFVQHKNENEEEENVFFRYAVNKERKKEKIQSP